MPAFKIEPPSISSPFHQGERELQEKTGVRERLEAIGRRTIRSFMPDQHRELFGKLPYLVVGALDERARPWASMLAGPPGFVGSPDPTALRVGALPAAGDPVAAGLVAGAAVGVLGIELATRRRNRMNGTIIGADEQGFSVRVAQSFGNCPKYIQAREAVFVGEPAERPAIRREGSTLSQAATDLVANADTFFIATASSPAHGAPSCGVDVSHRGGRPGFVRVAVEDGRTVLTAPDLLGNFHFNTFGNLAVNPGAGLLFVDFASGRLLSLTGRADVIWSGPERDAFPGAERLLRFVLEEGVWLPGAVGVRWSAAMLSPHLDATGTWADVA